MKIRIIKTSSEALSYLTDVQKNTDANRGSLGFMPIAAYEDALKKGRIWVAVDESSKYVGHIMHGGNSQREVRIFQICVADRSKRTGVATLLLDEITKYAEQLSCLNLRADVASDLPEAIKFWQSKGFTALAPRKKGNASGREVLLFYKRLSTPSLLPQEDLSLNITAKPSGDTHAAYVFDLNVFMSLIKGRSNDKLISEIMKAALAGEFNLFITPEFKEELERAQIADNPVLNLANKTLPVLAKIKDADIDKLQNEIRAIVFPARSKTRKHAPQDESDLKHLAYCIYNGIGGFITEERALLMAKEKLKEKYGLEVLSPEDFKIEKFGSTDISLIDVPLQSEQGSLSIADAAKSAEISDFLRGLDQDFSAFSKIAQKSGGRGVLERKLILTNGQTTALYVAQTRGSKHDVLDGYFVSSPELMSREIAFGHILESFLRIAQEIRAKEILLHIRKEDFDLEKICLQKGFQRTAESPAGLMRLTKVSCPLLVAPSNWPDFREKFLRNTGISLPKIAPQFHLDKAGTPIIEAAQKGRDYPLSLFELETFLSPSLLLLPKRPGVIISIAPAFGSSLLTRDAGTLPFAEREEALLRLEKAYFRAPTHEGTFSKGMPIVFYESDKGRGAIGCARITSVGTHSIENALKLYRRFGVLDEKAMKKYADKKGRVQVITFDNFKVFSKPIPMSKLKDIGCCRANLVGPEKLTPTHLYQIVHEGLGLSPKDVILSVQPDYVTKILNGKKTIELRKKPFPVNGGARVWIYSTSPTTAIEAVAEVRRVHKGSPAQIWKDFSSKCGIAKTDYDAYFQDSTEAFALILTDVRKLKKKMKLDEIKKHLPGFVPPQYFRYLPHESELFEALISLLY